MFLDEWAKREGRGAYERIRREVCPGVSYGTLMRAARRLAISEEKAVPISAATRNEVTVFELTSPETASGQQKRIRKRAAGGDARR